MKEQSLDLNDENLVTVAERPDEGGAAIIATAGRDSRGSTMAEESTEAQQVNLDFLDYRDGERVSAPG